MRGRKYVLWAAVISAAFVTAGLILSCGDDDGNGNGGAAVSCQDVCEKLDECFGSPGPFGETVADCVEACEEELAGGGGMFTEFYECIIDTDCWNILGTCLCKPACENLFDCGFYFWETTAQCVYICEEDIEEEEYAFYFFTCPLRFSSCHSILWFCVFGF
jgi:hypothetical protein